MKRKELPFVRMFSSASGKRSACRLLLCTLAFILFVVPSLYTPFHSKGEPREALAAQAVIEGQHILPKRYGDEIITKPPMMYWMVALFSLPQGEVTEFTARIPSMLLSLLSLLLLFEFLVRESTLEHASTSFILLLGSALWYRSSIIARVDMTLTGFLFGAFISFYFWERKKLTRLLGPVAIAALLTCATLTKGPVAIVIPGAVFFLYLLLQRYSLLEIARKLFFIFVPILAVTFAWYALAYQVGGDAFLEIFFLENIARFSGTMSEGGGRQPHEHSVFYLLGTVFAGTLPFSLILFLLPWKRLCLKLRSAVCSCRWRDFCTWFSLLPKPLQFSGIIVCVTVAFYCVPSSKRAEYLLSTYPFLSIVCGYLVLNYWRNIEQSIRGYSLSFLVGIFCIHVIVFVCLAFPDMIRGRDGVFYAETLSDVIFSSSSVVAGFLLLPLFGALYGVLRMRNSSTVELSLFSLGLYFLAIFMVSAILIPRFGSALSSKTFAHQIAGLLPEDGYTVSTGYYYPLNFYLKRKLAVIDEKKMDLSHPRLFLADGPDKEEIAKRMASNESLHVVAVSAHDIRKPGRQLYLMEIR